MKNHRQFHNTVSEVLNFIYNLYKIMGPSVEQFKNNMVVDKLK